MKSSPLQASILAYVTASSDRLSCHPVPEQQRHEDCEGAAGEVGGRGEKQKGGGEPNEAESCPGVLMAMRQQGAKGGGGDRREGGGRG